METNYYFNFYLGADGERYIGEILKEEIINGEASYFHSEAVL